MPPVKRNDTSTQIQALPTECLGHIFSFLPFKSLGLAAQVCEQWKECALHDYLWKALCFEAGCNEKNEGETWKDVARTRAKWAYCFVKGSILLRTPKITSSNSKSKAALFVNQEMNVKVCFNKDFIVTRETDFSKSTAILHIQSLVETRENFSLSYEGYIFTMALQRNILGVFGLFKSSDSISKLGLTLINLNEKNLATNSRFYYDTGEVEKGFGNFRRYTSVWEGYTLHIMVNTELTSIMNAWDFSEEHPCSIL